LEKTFSMGLVFGHYARDMNKVPESLIIIAGRHAYPLMLARAARAAGVKRIAALAFKGVTSREILQLADEVCWIPVGVLQPALDFFAGTGITKIMMAGQVTPGSIFSMRMDKAAIEVFKEAPQKNAHTLFGAILKRIEALGIEVLPGDSFMECYMPKAGLLSRREPTERERSDIELGLKLVKGTSEFEIGQTVAIKDGIIIAVEAWEGTNQAIQRAGKVGKAGCVIVKVPKHGHDMRFDIPVVGTKTFRVLRKAKISCLAVEAGKTILLEQEKLIALADQYNMAFVAVETDH
jgi:DUF1009 family protein